MPLADIHQDDWITRITQLVLRNIYLVFILAGVFRAITKKSDTTRQLRDEARARRARQEHTPVADPSPTWDAMQSPTSAPRTTRDNAFDFGSSTLFDNPKDDSYGWGKTKFGFDESEWGSSFGEKQSSEPTISTPTR